MSVLIIGGGSIGKRHARNVLSLGYTDVAVVEINPGRSQEVEKELHVRTFLSIEDAFAAKQWHVVFVCSPSRFHLEQAVVCAKYGADLFIEKPLSHSFSGLMKLTKLVKLKKLITMVGSNWKFYPLFQKMKELLDAGAIGRVLSARCQFGSYLPDWHPWEDHRKGYSANKVLGGGILLDSHEFDYLTWFIGKKVKSLVCFADRISDVTVDTEDVAEVLLQFENGAIGEIHQDYIQRFPQRNFEFFGSEGTLVWDINQKKVVLKSKTHGEQEFILPEPYDINTMYIEEARHFLDCVKERKETITSIEKGMEVLRLICAAKESSSESIVVSV